MTLGGDSYFADLYAWRSEGPGLRRVRVVETVPLAPSAAFLLSAGVALAAARRRRRAG